MNKQQFLITLLHDDYDHLRNNAIINVMYSHIKKRDDVVIDNDDVTTTIDNFLIFINDDTIDEIANTYKYDDYITCCDVTMNVARMLKNITTYYEYVLT